jgi:hypothetical protein
MVEGQPCAICHTRRPRRYCPGVLGHICPVCCGTERENTVSCPLDCPYLREARVREKEHYLRPEDYPNSEVKIDESFLQRNEALLIFVASGLANAALDAGNAIDDDVKEALASLFTTYKTRQSGLVFESRPDNVIAARVQAGIQERIREIEEALQRNDVSLRDSDVLGVLVFLQRLEMQKNNGRARSRAFIDFLREFFPPPELAPEPETNLIVP